MNTTDSQRDLKTQSGCGLTNKHFSGMVQGSCSELSLLWEIPRDLGSFKKMGFRKTAKKHTCCQTNMLLQKGPRQKLTVLQPFPGTWPWTQCYHPTSQSRHKTVSSSWTKRYQTSPTAHKPQRMAERWDAATHVCQSPPKKPVGLQHNRCADESRVKKAINFHQQKPIFLSQITPINNSKENNPHSSVLKEYTVFQWTQCKDFAEFRHSTGLM